LKYTSWYKMSGDRRERPLRDLAYYANLPQYPKKDDYETLAGEFFNRPPSGELMSTVTGQLLAQGYMTEERELLKRPERLVWRHNFTCRIGRNRLQVVGEGVTPDTAYAAAFMGFIYQLHIFGWLKQVFEQGGVQTSLEREHRIFAWSPSNIAAKMHIHNFSARYLQVPEVVFKRKEEGLIKATVTIPNTNYIASAIAEERRKAEFMAYAALKQQVESAIAKEDQTMDIRDDTYVNLDNARGILNLYKLKEPYGEYHQIEECVPGPQSTIWRARRLFWDGSQISEFHEMPTRRDANLLAALDAAIRLVKRNPSLLVEYQKASQENHGFVTQRLKPTFASLSPDIVATLADCVGAAGDTELANFQLEKYQAGYKPQIISPRRRGSDNAEDRYHNFAQSLAARSDELKMQQEYDREKPQLADAVAARACLPIYQHKAQIIAMVKNHDQCIVVGSTGSGKSTQVPQLILDDAIAEGRGALCNVICTQPRRLASVALALTVCNERERERGDMVGYRIGGDYHNYSIRGGSITYCTTEILANEMERAEEKLPHDVSHIIIDEIHERSVHLDRLLSTIKMAFSKRLAAGLRCPKLVLMSATVESDLFERYFEMVSQDGTVVRPPYLNIPGRVFRTEAKFLESYEHLLPPEMYQAIGNAGQKQDQRSSHQGLLPPMVEKPKQIVQWDSAYQLAGKQLVTQDSIDAVAASIVHICATTETGSILAFVPGANEIRSVHKALLNQNRVDIADANRYQILMLHRSNPLHLAEALEDAPENIRRIMISTNIAESSITFPDIEYVVDSGLRRTNIDSTVGYFQMLKDERISRANVLQRAGRAGRTKPGQYYGAFTTEQMQGMDVFPSAADVSMDRLEGMYLRAKVHFPDVSVQQFFESYITPIPPTKVKAAETHLRSIGALTEEGHISLIGYIMYRTTLEPSLARMILLGILFRCSDRAIILANLLSMKSYIFGDTRFDDASPTQRKATAQKFVEDSGSDLIAQLHAYEEYRAIQTRDPQAAREWAEQQGLAYQYFDLLQPRIDAVHRILRKANFYGSTRVVHDINADSDKILHLKMIICAGLYPNVAVHQRGPHFITHKALVVKPTPASVALAVDYTNPKMYDETRKSLMGAIFCYKNLVVSKSGWRNYHISTLTPISPLMLALFSNNVKLRPDRHNQILIDDSIPLKFSGDPNAANVFLDFKKVFDTALLAGMQNICEVWPSNKRKKLSTGLSDIILLAVQELLEFEDGQAMRREGDVGKFSLSPEKEEGIGEKRQDGARTWSAMSAVSPAPSIIPAEEEVICSICGQAGHIYDDCPRSAPTTPRRRTDTRRTGSIGSWDPNASTPDVVVSWDPNAFDDDEQGLPELPGDMDCR
jgi:HrpA-like RNA helicase